MRSAAPLVLLATALGGCGSGAPATSRSSAPRPVTTAAAPPGVDHVVATGSRDRLYVNVGDDGRGTVLTRLAVFAAGGAVRGVHLVPGAWTYPQAVPGQVEGLSWDGSRAVVVSTDDPSRLMAVATTGRRATHRIVVPRGRYLYDGLAVDGSRLFLTQRVDAHGARAYRVLRYDLATGVLDPRPVVDKLEGETELIGEPVARAATQDFLYTVYDHGPHPFVHALQSRGDYALCLDLPPERRAAARGAWSARRLGDDAAAIWNTVSHRAYRLARGDLGPMPYAEAVD